MNQKIIFQGKTKKGLPVIIRYPSSDDLSVMHQYINMLSKEQTYIPYQGQEITLAEEKKFLDRQLEKIGKNKAVLLLVFSKGKLIGISGIDMKDRVSAHEGVFGISVSKVYRGQGVGNLFMQTVIDEAIRQLPQLKIITLGVFANNSLAKQIYEKFGFIKSGVTPKGILHHGQYVDHIYMYKFVRDISE